jgi:hypothetical protein
MGLKLRQNIVFNDPESRIREYCEIEVYFGYDDQHNVNNTITRSDVDAANQRYAMIDRYDKNESKRLLAQAPRISLHLSKIPNQPLQSFNDKEWADLIPKIESLLKSMLSIYGIGIAKATKILHLKRPKLFPILDSLVIQFLTGKMPTSSKTDIRIGLSTLNKSRKLIQSQIDEFIELQRKVSDLPIDLTIVRLFDILCWTAQKWDIQGKTTAPKGRATYSLLKTVNPEVNT